jgi:AraC-like DNA-binding protein
MQTRFTTTEVAYRAGYGTRRSIYRGFRRETGLTPRTAAAGKPHR